MRACLALLVIVCLGCPSDDDGADAGTDAAVDAPERDAPATDTRTDTSANDADMQTDAGPDFGPAIILMIGDGMGPAQLDAASHYLHGEPGRLAIQSLDVHGMVDTASFSGITDSAAAATTMATGAVTLNSRVGLDRHGNPVENLVELAHRHGLTAGVVTSAVVTHASPGAFYAHELSRHDYVEIAEQVPTARPDVLLGGGMQFFDDALLFALDDAGYQRVTTADELAAADASRVIGLFAEDHLAYGIDRETDTTEPTLPDMAMKAIELLDRNTAGFFLMIEGARIDMAGHLNDTERMITETADFDATVAVVAEWVRARPNASLVITADHETGGMQVPPAGIGEIPEATWRWLNHTNAQVDVYATGEGVDALEGNDRDHTWIHEVLAARVEGRDVTAPASVLTPDGAFDDLPHRAVEQTHATEFGVGYNQLDALHLGVDEDTLGIGIEGLFQWYQNTVVVLIDVDYGAGTGIASMSGAVDDSTGFLDRIVGSLPFTSPNLSGYGADFAVVVHGGADPHLEDLFDTGGLRSLRNPSSLPWLGAAINFADDTRPSGAPLTPVFGRGMEIGIPLDTLYESGLPNGATIAVTVVLVNDDGGYASNQALPPFAEDTGNPGRTAVPLPGVVRFVLDGDDDGVADGLVAPTVERAE